ncbi:MAG: Gfo/Idh/MocA family oxidoreductase [Armatimonadetes bacterium]|nr:Gfo/Idh/MocA family oxidoreductase [Armatimonadota bacterium]
MQPVRIAVLGAGRGAGLARTVAHAPSAELVAICDANEARLAQAVAATGVNQTYTSYEALLDSDIDAVVVASPMPLHVEHSVAALRAGKHVLSEVTAATSLEQCYELLETANAATAKYMFAENYCYMRPWSLVLAMAKAGLFGELYYGEADQIQEFKGGLPDPNSGYNWRTGELAMRLGHHYITHDFGPLYWALGEPLATVACHGSGQRHRAWALADSTCLVIGETASGKLIKIRLDFFSDRPNSYLYYALQGTGGAYEGPHAAGDEHRVYLEGHTPRGQWQSLWDFAEYLPERWSTLPAEVVNDAHDGGAALMIEDFARCILDDTRPPLDVVDALNLTVPGLISEISRQRGGVPVEVPSFERRPAAAR